MITVQKEHVIESISDALQFISCYHPIDFIQAMYRAYEFEQSVAAKNAIAQILINSRLAAEGHRPICQDTGMACIMVNIGMDVHIKSNISFEDMINQAVAKAYTNPNNPLRASIIQDPAGTRLNTKNNSPAVIHTHLVPGNKIEFIVAAKGFGSENKAKMVMLNPHDDLVEWILSVVPKMGAGWCPPGILGIGIGGTAEKSALSAKESLYLEPVNIHELYQRGPKNRIEELRLIIYEKVNQLGIGAQGLGGLTTVLDVKIKDYPTHAAGLPVAIVPNCVANRYVKFSLDGQGPANLTPPRLDDWPKIDSTLLKQGRKVNVNDLTKTKLKDFKIGETLLLSGKILTGRDAAHKRLKTLLDNGQPLPDGVDFNNRFIYYVGPVPKVANEIVGPAGPTTSTRMDDYVDLMLDKTGLLGMIGKAERGDLALEAIKKHQSIYFIAVGGAAYLISKAIKSAKIIAFEDLGMEAIYEFEIEDMPITVAVDCHGQSIHREGPKVWGNKIKNISIKIEPS